MSRLTSNQRKLAYFLGVVVLLVPIIWLGRPAGRDEPGSPADRGKLADLRQEYDLGETSLGNVDPASSAMSLLLLGGRGIVVNQLHGQAVEYRDHKQWAALKAATDSIKLLQPHYIKVWEFQGWNLAYNVSAEWDNVPDRFYWVKQGGKFVMEGTERNDRNPDLAFGVGNRYVGHKIGRSDEWRFFRDYFVSDPDEERFSGGPDPDFNRGYDIGAQGDNYLAAHDWHVQANRLEETHGPQHVMMRELFRSYPARSYMEMANLLQKEGVFDEKDLARTGRPLPSRTAWEEGYDWWVNKFGREELPTPIGPVRLEINSKEELEELARRNNAAPAEVAGQVEFLQKTLNYPYWRERSRAESQAATAAAHREIYQGEQLFREGKLEQARASLLSGMAKLETMFAQFPGFREDELAVEEGLLATLYVRQIFDLNGEPIPDNLPLKGLWDVAQGTPVMETVQDQFRAQTSI